MSGLDSDRLDDLGERLGELPEPLAAAGASVAVARADGDHTGVRKYGFELGVAVVRYAVSVALAQLAARLEGAAAPVPVARALGRAVRLTDGGWCALLRTLSQQLGEAASLGPALGELCASAALGELVTARNAFIHEGSAGDDAPGCALAVLDAAAALLALPLCHSSERGAARAQRRMGLPLRAGAWRRQRGMPPSDLEPGGYLLMGEQWLKVTPYLPEHEGRLLLPEAPHASGKPWRMIDTESGARRPCPSLDQAVRGLAGDAATAPVLPSDRPALVGRVEVLDTMRRVAELAATGGVYLLLLTGPQGIGRGRLLEAAREAAPAFGLPVVLQAGCSERRRGPLRPLARALGGAVDMNDVAEAIARAFASDGVAVRAGVEAAVESVEEALVEASTRQPLLLLLDDLQWADEPTLLLLELLTERASRRTEGNLLVVVALRDEPARSPTLVRLLGEIEREVGPHATRLPLGPLDDLQAQQLAQGVAPLAQRLEQALVRGAAGLPFLVVQSLLAWFETGGLEWHRGRWRPASAGLISRPVPGMTEVLQARLAALFEPGDEAAAVSAELLMCLAFADGWLPLAVLMGVPCQLGREERLTERSLDALAYAGLVVARRGGIERALAQPLLRQAALAAWGERAWAPRLHRALLDALAAEMRDEDALFLSAGYRQLGDREQAARWLSRALAQAMEAGLFEQAARLAERLADEAIDEPSALGARLDAIEAWLRSGEATAAVGQLKLVDSPTARAVSPALWVRARVLALTLARATGRGGEDRELLDDADRIGVTAGVEARLALAAVRRGQAGLELVAAAIELLDARADGELRYRTLVLRLELLIELHGLKHPSCREAMVAARRVADSLGSGWVALDVANDHGVLEAEAGRYDEALAILREVAQQAGSHHYGTMQRGALVNMATVQLRAERPKAAASLAAQAAECAARAGDCDHQAKALSVQSEALRRLGKTRLARRAIDRAVELAEQVGDATLPIHLFRRADLRAAAEDRAGARGDTRRALALAEAAGSRMLRSRARLRLALLDMHDADGGRARAALVELLDELGDQGTGGELDRLRAQARELLRG